jgi:DNA-directed RNA polymerase subunit M/transcription elongation factor TFIIS
MKFCVKCNFMYYISINEKDSNQLSYYCRNCGHRDDSIAEEGACVLNTQLKKEQQNFNHIINQYTKLDPTLPRIYNIPCPNAKCATHGASVAHADADSAASASRKGAEVIYMRYDDDNLKYLYICTTCDTTWKTDDA